MAVTCPTLQNILAQNECDENLGGLATVIYVFNKADLLAPLTATKNQYSTPTFASGKGLYKFDCKEANQSIKGSSLGRRKGFKQTLEYVLEAVDKDSAEVARALNNLDLGYIIKDGDVSQIVYDANHKFVYDSDGINTDTGKAPEDDRQVNLSGSLSPVAYPNFFVTEPTTGGWDSLLASTASSAAGSDD